MRYYPHISLTSPMPRAEEVITFRISTTGQMLLALDDPQLIKEAYPSLKQVNYRRGSAAYRATRDDARTVCDDLYQRANPHSGFDEQANHRAAAYRDAARLYDQLFPDHRSK